jgi:hypothetical protein
MSLITTIAKDKALDVGSSLTRFECAQTINKTAKQLPPSGEITRERLAILAQVRRTLLLLNA